MDTLTANKPTAKPTEDFLPLNGTDHVEFYVGNAKQSAYYYQSAWGYELVAYAGPETGVRDRASYVLQQGKIRIVLTTAMQPDHEIAGHQLKHGDGVKVLALWVDDATKSFEETTKRGAKGVMNPVKWSYLPYRLMARPSTNLSSARTIRVFFSLALSQRNLPCLSSLWACCM
jgi:4-hydroxyphenylpyruvate dioxygenase